MNSAKTQPSNASSRQPSNRPFNYKWGYLAMFLVVLIPVICSGRFPWNKVITYSKYSYSHTVPSKKKKRYFVWRKQRVWLYDVQSLALLLVISLLLFSARGGRKWWADGRNNYVHKRFCFLFLPLLAYAYCIMEEFSRKFANFIGGLYYIEQHCITVHNF